MMIKARALLALLAGVALLAAASPVEIGKVGEEPILMDTLVMAMMHREGGDTYGPGWLAPLLAVVEGRLMILEAGARGEIVTDEDVDRFLRFGEDPGDLQVYNDYVTLFGEEMVLDYYRMVLTVRRMKDEVLPDELLLAAGQVPTEEEMLAFFVEHQREMPFTEPAQMRLAVILVDGAEDAAEVESILMAGEPFEEVAKTWSLDEATKGRGGDIGQGLTPQQLATAFPPPMVPAIDALEVGAFTGPYPLGDTADSTTLFVKMLDRSEQVEHGFDEMRSVVADVLEAMRVPDLYEEWARERLQDHGVVFHSDLFAPVAEDLLAPEFSSDLSLPEAPAAEAPAEPAADSGADG